MQLFDRIHIFYDIFYEGSWCISIDADSGLGPLVMIFDAAVVFVTNSSLLFTFWLYSMVLIITEDS